MKIISLIIVLFGSMLNAIAQDSLIKVFTLHEEGQIISLYLDIECKTKVIEIYPFEIEGNTGVTIYINDEIDSMLRVHIPPIGSLFVKKGDVAVNICTNIDGTFILFKEPNYKSEITAQISQKQTTPIYGVHNNWLYVYAINDLGEKVEGWLPPNMQWPSQFMSCT